MSRLRGVCAVLAGGLFLLCLTMLVYAKPVAAAASDAAGLPVGSGSMMAPEFALAAVVGVGGLVFVLRPRRRGQ